MLILDTNKSILLDMSMFDFDPAHIAHDTQKHIIQIPLNNCDIVEATNPLAYDVSSRQNWLWPDLTQTTAAFEIDYSRTFLRFSLKIGTQPEESRAESISPEWKEFEAHRREAIQQYVRSGGGQVYDSYPIMLDEEDKKAITEMLYAKFGVF